MVKVGNYKIPFNEKGNPCYYEDWRTKDWRENTPFQTTLTYNGFSRGRSAANLDFITSDGKEVTMFLKDFGDAITKMTNGQISGTFQYIKRGCNYGIVRVGD